MNASRRTFFAVTLVLGVLGITTLARGAGAMARGDDADGTCRADCLEAIYESVFVHVFFLDAERKRHYLSTSLRSEEQVAGIGPKWVQLGPNVFRSPVLAVDDASKLIGCGVDGYGYDSGDTMWSSQVFQTSGPSGSSRTDARAIYTARGRGVLFTTTTHISTSSAPTSSTTTSEIAASRRSGLPSGCTQAQ